MTKADDLKGEIENLLARVAALERAVHEIRPDLAADHGVNKPGEPTQAANDNDQDQDDC